MKRFFALLVLAAGCSSRPPENIDLLCECFAEAALAAVAAKDRIPAPDAPKGCCQECKKTPGRVKSGDGLSWVPCPCPDSCPCKSSGLARPMQ